MSFNCGIKYLVLLNLKTNMQWRVTEFCWDLMSVVHWKWTLFWFWLLNLVHFTNSKKENWNIVKQFLMLIVVLTANPSVKFCLAMPLSMLQGLCSLSVDLRKRTCHVHMAPVQSLFRLLFWLVLFHWKIVSTVFRVNENYWEKITIGSISPKSWNYYFSNK